MDIATVDRLLTTTRVVRRRLDLSRPVERDVVERCIDVALQAPTGSNAQGWHFAAELLGLPPHVTEVALLAVAYFTGEDFKPARRLPAHERTHWNGWGTRT